MTERKQLKGILWFVVVKLECNLSKVALGRYSFQKAAKIFTCPGK